jgi:hypothetical protein
MSRSASTRKVGHNGLNQHRMDANKLIGNINRTTLAKGIKSARRKSPAGKWHGASPEPSPPRSTTRKKGFWRRLTKLFGM